MEEKTSRKRQSFLHGALILTASIMIVKVIGALFKVPLTWIITEDGMGYFNTAYMFYSPLYSLATAGFPIAISRLVSESYTRRRFRDIRQIHKASIPIFITTGAAGFLLMFLGAPFYIKVIGNPNALPSMLALAPAILFSCLTAIYRGYYEGLRNMYPTAISEITEAVCKLVIGLSASWWVVKTGMEEYQSLGTVFGLSAPSEEYAKSMTLPFAAAGAILGVTVGSLLGFLILLCRHKRKGDGITRRELQASPNPMPLNLTTRRLVKTAIPIGIGALAVNIAGLVDATFLQTRIRNVMDTAPGVLLDRYEGMIPEVNIAENTVPNFLYGCFSMALTLFMVVPAITQAFGISALPNVTAAWTRGVKEDIKRNMEAVLRITALFCIPAGMGMAALAGPVTRFIFGDRASSPITSKVLVIMGIGAVFASLSTPINSMLQAVGRVDLPVKLLFAGLTVKVALNYFLVGIPEINVLGAGAGTLACYLIITVLAFISLCRVTGIVPNLVSVFIKPAFSAAFCVAAAWAAQGLLCRAVPDKLATLISLVLAVVIYVIALFCLHTITRDDVLMLPKGQKIAKLLEKNHWIG